MSAGKDVLHTGFQPPFSPADAQPFPIPDGPRIIELKHLDTVAVLGLLRDTALGWGRTAISVTIAHGSSVRFHDVAIGYLPEPEPEITHLLVELRCWLEVDNQELKAQVRLPERGALIPRNHPPEQSYTLLPDGAAALIDLSKGECEVAAGPAQLLVSLRESHGQVLALLDNKVLGPLRNRRDSQELLGLVLHFRQLGLIPLCRAFVNDAGEVALTSARTWQLGPQELEPTLCPLPPLPTPQEALPLEQVEKEWVLMLPDTAFIPPTQE